MYYQRNIKNEEIIEKGPTPKSQDKNNEKKIISTTTIEKISSRRKPIEISKISKISNIAQTTIEKKEIQTTKRTS